MPIASLPFLRKRVRRPADPAFSILAWILRESEVGRGFPAIAIGLEIKGYSLTIVETSDVGTLQSGDVDEYVPLTIFRCNKAEAFGGVEPFHGAIGHRDIPFISAARKMRRLGRADGRKLSRKEQVRET